ncbi:elongation factor Ts [Actinomycetota bacterium]|nr:elongation factor Ts [Actinomycetota bacterium]
MANYTAGDIKELREITGAGMLDVKKALDESNGDKAKATEILRVAGAKAAAKRGERVTAEGLVAAKVDGKVGYIIELDCETDFVAKSDDFIALADEVLDAIVKAKATDVATALKAKTVKHATVADAIEDIAGTKLRENIVLKNVGSVEGEKVGVYLHKKDPALPPYVGVLVAVKGADVEAANKIATHLSGPLAINGSFPYKTIEDVPAETIESEKNIVLAKNPGKPANIVEEKIIPGALNAYYKLNVLSEQHFGLDDGQPTIKSILGNGEIVDFTGFLVGSAE